ncbi:hypothetical protein MA16_Dca005065 [Dendrobium catenatum]|uniref:Uncharacterized protein n=1 Tax=Dendrobium catenatum TaxID=906689 RepID=A0A2I0WGS8_9ASPA|nr:hypothetical protein MA16_Dca005065 [Dendrobium catenatum]
MYAESNTVIRRISILVITVPLLVLFFPLWSSVAGVRVFLPPVPHHLVSEPPTTGTRMAESSRRAAPDEDRSQDDLRTVVNNISKEMTELSAEFRFAPDNASPTRRGHAIAERTPRGLPTVYHDYLDSEDDDGMQTGAELFKQEERGYGDHLGARRTRDRPPNHQGEFRVKIDITFFEGRLHIEDYLDSERAVETFFDYMEIPPEKQVKYVMESRENKEIMNDEIVNW